MLPCRKILTITLIKKASKWLAWYIMSFEIEKIHAREILDSRGNPTIEVDVYTCCGFGRAAVPSGASTGTHEALELRDGGDRYDGKGVLKAVKNVNEVIAPEMLGMNASAQREIDEFMIEMDGTPNKSNLGANAILGVSLAVAKAAASSCGMPLYKYLGGVNTARLPIPSFNVLNGGKHAGNELSIQEFMIQPTGAKTFSEGLRMAVETYHALGKILKGKYGVGATNVGYEGGYAPPLIKTRDALDAIMSALDVSGYGEEIKIGLDAAASSFYMDGGYSVDGNRLYARRAHRLLCRSGQDLSHYSAGRPLRGGGLRRLCQAYSQAAGHDNSRRRPVCHQHKAPGEGHKDVRQQCPAAQAQPDRLRLRGL